MLRIVVIVSVLGGVVYADAALDAAPRQVTVAVDQTVEVEVGTLIGAVCDDPTILKGEMKTKGDTNRFLVTGVAPGTTLCRVGTEPQRPRLMFQVHIVAKAAVR